jgi:hypothetical protein
MGSIIGVDINSITSIAGVSTANISNFMGISGLFAGGTFEPEDFDFEDGDVGYTTSTITFTKSGRLYISATQGSSISAFGYLNNTQMFFLGSQRSAEANPNQFDDINGDPYLGYFSYYGIFDVNVGDEMYFQLNTEEASTNGEITVEFRIDGFDGTLISSFTATYSGGCYLTTATVQYKGLNDNGPELTAMRSLREYYRGDVYYDNLIKEYYQNSQIIIDGINDSVDPSLDYEYIYQSVLTVKQFVDNGQWEDAKDEYVNTYFTLKNKYVIQ